MNTVDILMPDGTTGDAAVLHLSPHGTYAVVKLTGTAHKGTVDVFHTGTGKRATPPRHFGAVRTQKVAHALADSLDAYDPVHEDGALRVTVGEYHAHLDAFVAALGH